jgi:hypothetical protein
MAHIARAEDPVPIDQEPMHKLRFHNAHVRFFDVDLPPGYRGVMHIHQYDGVFVNIAASETENEDWGKAPQLRPKREIGETYFIGYAGKLKAHRVNNVGNAPYHVTDTEILTGCGNAKVAEDAMSGKLILENERVRITRIQLEPGASTRLYGPCGMLVAVTGANLLLKSAGAEERIAFQPAGFKWRDSAEPMELTNAGSSATHVVDILIKQ